MMYLYAGKSVYELLSQELTEFSESEIQRKLSPEIRIMFVQIQQQKQECL